MTEFKALPYQAAGVAWLLRKPYSGLIMRPGLGKTATVLTAFTIAKKKGLVKRMLITAPRQVAKTVWAEEAAKWNFKLKVGFAYGAKLEDVLEDPQYDVVTCTVDAWARIRRMYTRRALTLLFDWLVADESTKFKHASSGRSKDLYEYLDCFGRRTILTGTIAPNGYIDLHGQMLVVDRGHRLGRYITQYEKAYFNRAGYGGFLLAIKDGATKKIEKKLADVLYFVDDAKLGLKPPTKLRLDVELPDKAREVYNELKREMILTLQDQPITAVNAGVLGGKLRQVANGALYGNKREILRLHEEKAEAVENLVEQLQGNPLLLAYEFHHDLDALGKRFPKAPCITGGMAPGKVEKLLTEFNKGDVPVLLAQMDTIAYGLNLQAVCHTVCWYSIPWNLETYEQFNKRVHRMGQKRNVFVYHVIARGTTDERVFAVLKGKEQTQLALMAALSKYLAKEGV